MTPMIPWGFGAGLGVFLIRRSIMGPKGSLIDVAMHRMLTRLSRGARISRTNLAITDRTLAGLITERLLVSLTGLAIPGAMVLVTGLGGVSLPISLMVVVALAGAFVGYQLPVWQLGSRAESARRRFRTSLSAYLDLVSIMLAGGAGIETSLLAAARVGDGPAFQRISASLDVARTSRRSPWDTLAELGDRIGVSELPDLAATVRLGGEQGARMTASLVAKASSLRARQLAEVEADANAATEKMGLPMVMLFIGFLILLGYPAMHMINAGFEA